MLRELPRAREPEDGGLDVQAVGPFDAGNESNALAEEAVQFDSQDYQRLVPFESERDQWETRADTAVHHRAWECIRPPVERARLPEAAAGAEEPPAVSSDRFHQAKASRGQPVPIRKPGGCLGNHGATRPRPILAAKRAQS